MKISDELRDYCKKVLCYTHYYDKFWYFADRIDKELVELPKDREGMPIHVGDTVWMADKGALELTVRSITLHACGEVNVDASCEGCHAHVSPDSLTHNRPDSSDSWERIAYDIETVVPIDDEGDERFRRELAGRIRKLAAKED